MATAVKLDNLDLKILEMLSINARKPYLEIARACNVSGAAIHQRIQKLYNLGVINGSMTLINPEMVGYDTCAFVGLFVSDPAKFNDVIEGLKRIPEVVECYYTTGKYDIFIKLYAHNNEHMLTSILDKFLKMGVARSETLISFKEIFKRQIRVNCDNDAEENPIG